MITHIVHQAQDVQRHLKITGLIEIDTNEVVVLYHKKKVNGLTILVLIPCGAKLDVMKLTPQLIIHKRVISRRYRDVIIIKLDHPCQSSQPLILLRIMLKELPKKTASYAFKALKDDDLRDCDMIYIPSTGKYIPKLRNLGS